VRTKISVDASHKTGANSARDSVSLLSPCWSFRWMTLWAEDGEVGVVLASEMAIVAMVDV
jgi:hypothetical protein